MQKIPLKTIIILPCLAILFSGCSFHVSKNGTETVEAKTQVPKVKLEDTFDIEKYQVEEGDTFANIMANYGVSYSDMLDIVSSSMEMYDLTKVVVGHEFRKYTKEKKLIKIEYDIDAEDYILIEKNSEGVAVSKKTIEYEVTVTSANATIDSSLFLAGSKVGISDETILGMAEILAWNIDFATQVQQGDSFSVVYEERTRNGNPSRPGNILAVSFTNSGVKHQAYRFVDSNEKEGYYDEKGNSLVRQFLRAPLHYSRITSGFAYARFHPILGKNTPHRAIDYAAPVGTPIMATADGTVTFAGWSTIGYGNFIDVKHNGIYSTQYAHLSRFGKGIKAGAHVQQGQIIGYVGSTGYSTGPHLHYQIKKNGHLVNPLEIELPAGDPIPEDQKEAFQKFIEPYKDRI
ncbi:MAG: peptidase M23 [Candidatus Magasanikbacteria bacterium CG11_big_fil_rev_8_21_14_0_20_39_34]|uniref:Peptidase M23 n=1 Tax=Candidatus Magasanikbacteria bacterium CG11_big_fil_rev_8_21_14_0_20_39_34 TaxID=1974653 RepID=A0A2H0N5A8_9BACT|nr:MAG: peptidase M23 [Candidatus Magasanikbacteria bacterium CG11_big_fil_rev_8_21_14_0_20_39_34]